LTPRTIPEYLPSRSVSRPVTAFIRPQSYIHMAAYIFTILWGILRPAVCFKYSPKVRRALGP
jgi:hypothetical protein